MLPRERGFSFDLVTWVPLRTEMLVTRRVNLIVALAAPDVAPALKLFDWLSSHPVCPPLLAVLPDPAEEWFIESAIKAATDFVILPVRDEELRQRIARMLAPSGCDHLGDRLPAEAGLRHLVGSDPAFTRVIAELPRIARSDMPPRIAGETGTGKTWRYAWDPAGTPALELARIALSDAASRRL